VSVKEGQFIYYSLNTTVMDEILKWIMQFKSPLPKASLRKKNKNNEEV